MRIPLLLLLFLANIGTHSQSYCPVSNTQNMHIAVESSFPSLPISSIVTIQNDSIYASPDYTVYFNKPILRYNNMPFSLEICKLSNLLGNTIIYDNNNYYNMVNNCNYIFMISPYNKQYKNINSTYFSNNNNNYSYLESIINMCKIILQINYR